MTQHNAPPAQPPPGPQPYPAYAPYPAPNVQPRPANSFGCWLTAAVTLFVFSVLVLVGLFLPPFNLYDRLFSEPLTPLRASGDTLSTSDGSLRLTVASGSSSDDFAARIETVALSSFEAADPEAGRWVPAVRASVPYYLALQSPVYDIRSDGEHPQATTLHVQIPPMGALQPALLDLYGWYAATESWEFIPAQVEADAFVAQVDEVPQRVALFQSAPLAPTVLASYGVTQFLTPEAAAVLDVVAPGGLQPMADGRIVGHLAPGFMQGAGYRIMPAIHDYADPRALDTETVNLILSNPTARANHAQAIQQVASNGGFAGIIIDYRGVSAGQRANFVQFLQDLQRRLAQNGLLLGVVLPSGLDSSTTWGENAYYWPAIGQIADVVQVNLPIDPQAYAPDGVVPQFLNQAVRQISRQKLLLGLSAQSVRVVDGQVSRIGYNAALAGLGDVTYEAAFSDTGTTEPGSEIRARLDGMQAAAGVDATLNAPHLDYLNDAGDSVARMWLSTGDALRYRMDVAARFALAGVAFDDLLSGDLAGDALAAIGEFANLEQRAPAPVELALRWRIESADGVVDEMTTGINDEIVVTLAAPDGNYAFNVSVIGVGQQTEDDTPQLASARTGAAVALFRATPTPTPLPTETPTPTPTVTPTPRPEQARPAASSAGGAPAGGGFGAAPPPAGSIGNFEYGGHVQNYSSPVTIGAMRRSGMTWLKVQKRFYRGSNNIGEIANAINVAHQNGFRALIGTVGDPNELAAGGAGYVSDYANWLSQIAAAGADAIEVWNEPNLDREWPRGQISGAAYAEMLRQGYNAIKRTNSSVMVISAAPAPTGAEAAFPGQVVNDDRWLRDMVNAGGLNYADCVGIHYNEGIVPPSQTSGDPRDSFYSRYYWSLLNLYWGIIGGQRPLCFTELGYLSSEGFPPLPNAFAWASNVTVSQQAAWLAQAAAQSAQSGRVRMMIVWNVDFQGYGADPQAGFAMIRPNGTCPACDALAAAR